MGARSSVISTPVVGEYGTYLAETASFASGGVGTLHRVEPDLVFKRYRTPVTARPDVSTLLRLREQGRDTYITRRLELGAAPESSINWPIDTIPGPAGSIAGVVLPRVPSPYARPDGTLQTLDFLLLKRARPPEPKVRIIVLYRLCEILRRLDDHGYVHGDISSKNIVWRGAPQPSAYLIDADGMTPQRGGSTTGAVATPHWTDPRVSERKIAAHDLLSDRYALALAIYRGLFLTPGNLDKRGDGRWPRPTAIHPQTKPRLRRALENSLGDALGGKSRWSAEKWQHELGAAFFANGDFDDAAIAHLPDPSSAPDATGRSSASPGRY